LFLQLNNGEKFSKIDLADAYLQLCLDENAQKLVVVNTPWGLFKYKRLPFGVASAPAVFQRFISQVINGIDGCASYLDDIIVTGQNDAEHLSRLEAVFERLAAHGLRCNRQKCDFFKPEVSYLGYKISAIGISPTGEGCEAVRNLPRPANIKELESFLGKVNYYHRFLHNQATTAAPLNQLRKKDVEFVWKDEQEVAFNALKNQIIQAPVLMHFNPACPLVLRPMHRLMALEPYYLTVCLMGRNVP